MPHSVPPILTFGFERSGTTLLSMMLGSHPDLAVPFSPTGLWYRYAHRLDDYDGLRGAAALDRLVRDILADERIRMWDVEIDFDAVRTDLDPGDFAAVVRRVHEVYARKSGKSHWALHDIATLFNMDAANIWFPDARFVQIVRDVRDVALSFVSYEFGTANLCETAAKWRLAVHANLQMGAMIGGDRYRVVRYEDLVARPQETLESLCAFLGIRYAPEMLDYAGTVDRKVPTAKLSLWPALRGKPDRDRIGQWRSALPAYKVRAIEELAGDLLDRLDYMRDARRASLPMNELYLHRCLFDRGGRLLRLRRRLLSMRN